MNIDLLVHVTKLLGTELLNVNRLSGGDVGQLYLIDTSDCKYVLKMQSGAHADAMLSAEKEGLEFIHRTNTLLTPKVRMLDRYDDSAFLLLEYIEVKDPEDEDFISFGRQLAEFHNCSGDQFGWSHHNFIGLLRQSNKQHLKWGDFYLSERIVPQMRYAVDHGWLSAAESPEEEKWDSLCANLLPDILPSLLHGDLWSGNFLIRKDGIPFLIDPAVYYGHSEIDLAMSKLFGGFPSVFYDAYYEVRKSDPGEAEREALYQLYFLLVHLNMFGKAYKQSVLGILDKFF